MVPKGPGCAGCPFEHRSKWMVPDEIRPSAKLLVMGQNPGAHEEAGERLVARAGKIKRWEPATPAPFLGDSGYDLERTYLPLSGLGREDVSLANAIRCRVGGTNQLPNLARTDTRDAIHHCQREYPLPESSVHCVALGEYALYALTGEDGGDPPPYGISRKVAGWRGWVLPHSPFKRLTHTDIWTPRAGDAWVYVTLHPASVYEAPWLKPAVLRDWQKLGELLSGRWPTPLPVIQRSMTRWPDGFSYDTEFWEDSHGKQRLVRWSASDGTNVYAVEAGDPTPPPRPGLRVVLHQADADIDTLEASVGRWADLDDTMYAHAALHAESAHDLEFLGSLYARTNRWKHLSQRAPVVYAAGDAYATWDVWQALKGELARDPASERVYRECMLPLLPIVSRARRMGIRVEHERARAAVQALQGAQLSETLRAQAASGWPLNLGSGPQVIAQAQLEGWMPRAQTPPETQR